MVQFNKIGNRGKANLGGGDIQKEQGGGQKRRINKLFIVRLRQGNWVRNLETAFSENHLRFYRHLSNQQEVESNLNLSECAHQSCRDPAEAYTLLTLVNEKPKSTGKLIPGEVISLSRPITWPPLLQFFKTSFLKKIQISPVFPLMTILFSKDPTQCTTSHSVLKKLDFKNGLTTLINTHD